MGAQVKVLFQAGAFGGFSDLWVVPQLRDSKWTQQIDWYLNFIFTRAGEHRSLGLSEEVVDILKANEIPWAFAPSQGKGPLMVDPHGRFPARQIIMMPEVNGDKAWVEHVNFIWKGLGRPSLRVFLPEGLEVERFGELWADESFEVALVPDRDTAQEKA